MFFLFSQSLAKSLFSRAALLSPYGRRQPAQYCETGGAVDSTREVFIVNCLFLYRSNVRQQTSYTLVSATRQSSWEKCFCWFGTVQTSLPHAWKQRNVEKWASALTSLPIHYFQRYVIPFNSLFNRIFETENFSHPFPLAML